MRQLTYAFGDIHGCYAELLDLFEQAQQHLKRARAGEEEVKARFIFLGDYVDRGPMSRQVIEFLAYLHEHADEEVVTLLGNHEAMMIAADRGTRDDCSLWVMNGGSQTLDSYEHDGVDSVKDQHITFLKSDKFRLYYHDEKMDRLFVHAGVMPHLKLDEQVTKAFQWIREPFLSHIGKYAAAAYVVHGHTPQYSAHVRDNRCNLDSACVFGYELSCGVFDETQLEPLEVLTVASTMERKK